MYYRNQFFVGGLRAPPPPGCGPAMYEKVYFIIIIKYIDHKRQGTQVTNKKKC